MKSGLMLGLCRAYSCI